jgi:8-oxo-dGTP pyrophosphatase MutT (NUDIX family)
VNEVNPVDGGRVERELLRRDAARVLVLDAADRVLLLRGTDPAAPDVRYWWTLGGGREPGESARACAVRELHEEAGLLVPEADLVGPLHRNASAFAFDRFWVEQDNEFFAVRVETWTAAPAALDVLEIASILGTGWWTLDELRAQRDGLPHGGPGVPGEAVYPAELPEVLAAALAATR